jgi:hypothetical protein
VVRVDTRVRIEHPFVMISPMSDLVLQEGYVDKRARDPLPLSVMSSFYGPWGKRLARRAPDRIKNARDICAAVNSRSRNSSITASRKQVWDFFEIQMLRADRGV